MSFLNFGKNLVSLKPLEGQTWRCSENWEILFRTNWWLAVAAPAQPTATFEIAVDKPWDFTIGNHGTDPTFGGGPYGHRKVMNWTNNLQSENVYVGDVKQATAPFDVYLLLISSLDDLDEAMRSVGG